MAYPISDAFRAALAMPHRVRVQVTLLRAGAVVMSDVPFESGEITVDSRSFVRRSLSLSVPPVIPTGDYKSVPTGDLIKTRGDELRVRWGMVFPDGSTEWVPLGVFRVDSVPWSATLDSPVTITGKDRCADIVDDDFLQPLTFESGSTKSLITTLIKETLPTVGVQDRTRVRDARVPVTQADGSRSKFIEELATSIGAVVYCDGLGDFIIADAPTTEDDTVATLRTGLGGVIVSADSASTREGVFNRVVVRGESPSGDFAPVQGTITDNDPTSPTRFGDRLAGRYGKVTKFFDFPTVSSVAQAQATGRSLLAKYVGLTAAMDISSVPMPHLDAGDSVLLIPEELPAGAGARKHIVDSYSLSLKPGGAFTLRTRDVREVGLDES